MAKLPCAACGKKLGMLSLKVNIANGAVCMNCLNNVGISTLGNASSYNFQSIRELINSRQEMVKNFKPTKSVATYIDIDENNKYFKIGKDIFSYENLLSFELLEDGQSITKGGLGQAVAGGLLFGGVGAIVGGVTGGKKSKGICNSMKLRISLKNAHTDIVYINFISTQTKTNGFIYKTSQDSAQKCIVALETINDINQNSQNQSVVNNQTVSAADEIMKFKNLLDQGILTQEEFDAKKKEILGL